VTVSGTEWASLPLQDKNVHFQEEDLRVQGSDILIADSPRQSSAKALFYQKFFPEPGRTGLSEYFSIRPSGLQM